MKIDTVVLKKAIAHLSKSMEFAGSDSAQKDTDLFRTFRTACIKSFEYTYELSIQLIKRQLETMASSPDEVDRLNFKDLIRTAAEKGLISEVSQWFDYRETRNLTVHTYDEDKADQVYRSLPGFKKSAIQLEQLISSLN